MSTAADVRVGNLRLPERYRVERRIASGGSATVWCAEDNVLGRSVAVKVLSEVYSADRTATTRFKREARAAARLSGHPNVVTIYDVGEARQGDTVRPFLVMEFLSGGTVAEALRAGPVERGAAVRWLHEAAGALDFAHGRGVIHRDIKPANFLLDGDRMLHVADFGIARLGTEDAITTSGHVLATAAYAAPERVHGGPASDSSDRYAFAVAAFEILVGERPFSASHVAAQARQHVEQPPPRASARNAALPPALDAVLMRGMAKQPEDRWRTATEFADAVERALSKRSAGGSEPLPPVRWTSVAKSPPARRPRRMLATAALLAAVLTGIIVAVATQSSAPKPASKAASETHHPSLDHASKASKAANSRTASSTTPSTAAPVGASTTPTGSPRSSPVTNLPAAAAPPVGGAGQEPTALEAEGHQLMLAGNYQAAIAVLRRAVATADPSSVTYAYAEYDLGRSLRLSGDPQAAIPILQKRLEIPNQIDVVRAELDAAIREASNH